jgi:predicted PolB exonuclease-like 3'-5' exonuclease
MAFAVFDIETRIDKRLLNDVFHAGEKLGDDEAYGKLIGEGGFPPLTLHVPISIAVGKVGDDHALHAVESLALANYSEERLCREFWDRAERFAGCLVSFNGRQFDIPVMELQALRLGIPTPLHFSDAGSHRYDEDRHLDLFEFISNRGAARLRGGLDLLLKLIGLPGKVGIDGSQVQRLFDEGRLDEIHRYCRSDVIQTYFLFLRVQLIRGRLDADSYQSARAASTRFLDELGHPCPGPMD